MRILLLAFALLFATAVPAAEAQRVDRKERVKKRIRMMRAIVLAEELQLDETTAAKLMPILNRYDDEFAKLAREAVALRKQAETTTDDAALEKLVDRMVANQRARWDLDEKRFAEVRKVLTPAQQAKILVVLPEIDRRILDSARQVLRKNQKAKRGKRGQQGKKARRGAAGADTEF